MRINVIKDEWVPRFGEEPKYLIGKKMPKWILKLLVKLKWLILKEETMLQSHILEIDVADSLEAIRTVLDEYYRRSGNFGTDNICVVIGKDQWPAAMNDFYRQLDVYYTGMYVGGRGMRSMLLDDIQIVYVPTATGVFVLEKGRLIPNGVY